MNARQPSWNRFEAAILLEALIASIDGSISRADAVKCVSDSLRKMAVSQGIEIDETYRNENGISFQLRSMESAYYGKTIFKPATQLFTEVASIYRNIPNEFQRLLKEAKAMIENKKTVEDDYLQYLAEKVSPAQLSELYPCYSEIEAFCSKVKVLKKPLFQTTDFEIIKQVQRTIEQNKIFRLTHKRQFNKIVTACRHYYIYIKEGRFPQTTQEDRPEAKVEVQQQSTPELKPEAKTETPLTRTEQDSRLLQKYPIIYKRIFSALCESSDSAVSISKLYEAINRIARPAVLEEILDNVSWAKPVGENYAFSAEIIDHSVVIDEEKPVEEKTNGNEQTEATTQDEETYCIDFNKDFDLAHSKPVSFSYFEEEIPFDGSWTDLYVTFAATMVEDYPHILSPGMSFSSHNSQIELAQKDNYDFMIRPRPIPGTDLMLETSINATNIVDRIKYILDLCNIDYENVAITYRKKESFDPKNDSKASKLQREVSLQDAFNSITFGNYLMELGMADATCRSYVSAVNNCEAFAKEHCLPSWQLYVDDRLVAEETIRLLLANADFLEYNTRQHNRFRAALQKYLGFINGTTPQRVNTERNVEVREPYRNEQYEAVLGQYFEKGFRMESPLEIRKFRRYYSSTHEIELAASDDEISNIIQALCIVFDGKAFLPSVMLSDELRDKLFEYIDAAFAGGKAAIYYQAIYTEFADAFLDHHIHNPDMLKAYLSAMNNGKFYVGKSFVSKDANVTLDPLSEIRSCLLAYARLVEYDELFAALPHLPQNKIKFILANNGEFVNNGQGAYFHEAIVRLSDEELEGIAEIISQTIEDKDFIGGNELYEAIKTKYSYIIEENKSLSVYGFRDALKAKIGDRFSFKGNIISRAGTELTMSDVFARYAQAHDRFTLSELQGLASNLAAVIYFDAVYDNSLRISKEEFVSKDMAQFSIADTDEALDRVCIGKYIPITEVENFGGFPYAGFTWNCYLLEHYVASYSQKFKLLHSGFNGTECAGAIVRCSAGIDSFDDLIVDLLVNNPIELQKAPVLQFLSDNGYLARKRYSEIESLIIKAKAQRQRKGVN